MTLALARDKLHYGSEQLAALAGQIRLGDLTPISRIYEEDIKSPLKSAVMGTLLRSIFVQVQKAKVSLLVILLVGFSNEVNDLRWILTKLWPGSISCSNLKN